MSSDTTEFIFQSVIQRDLAAVMNLIDNHRGDLDDAILLAVKRQSTSFFNGLDGLQRTIGVEYFEEMDEAMERVMEQSTPLVQKLEEIDYLFLMGASPDEALYHAVVLGDLDIVTHLVETQRFSAGVYDNALRLAILNLHTQLILYFIHEVGLEDYNPYGVASIALLQGDADLMSIVLPQINPKEFDDRLWKTFVKATTLQGSELSALLMPLAYADLDHYKDVLPEEIGQIAQTYQMVIRKMSNRIPKEMVFEVLATEGFSRNSIIYLWSIR